MEHNKRQTPMGNLHIYEDDKTGNFYYWNGSELVLLGNRKPQIGDTGDEDFQKKEAEERAKKVEEERQEAQRRKDAGEAYDEAALADPETEEARQQRIKDIQNFFDDQATADEIERESQRKIDRELARKKAADMNTIKNSKIQQFNTSLRRFLNNELERQREHTWQKPHMGYEHTGIIRQGIRREENENKPSINVYFDQSGSWDDSDIQTGMEAIGVLKNYEDRGEITVKLYYFSNNIYDDPAEARADGGTGAGAKLIAHIQTTNPDNVIIMTDDDIGSYWIEIYDAPKIRVKGAVWFLFRKKPSPALPIWLKGAKQNLQFII